MFILSKFCTLHCLWILALRTRFRCVFFLILRPIIKYKRLFYGTIHVLITQQQAYIPCASHSFPIFNVFIDWKSSYHVRKIFLPAFSIGKQWEGHRICLSGCSLDDCRRLKALVKDAFKAEALQMELLDTEAGLHTDPYHARRKSTGGKDRN